MNKAEKKTKGRSIDLNTVRWDWGYWRLASLLVTADCSAAITIHAAESLRPPQIHFHKKRIIPSLMETRTSSHYQIYIKLLTKIFRLSLRQGVLRWWYRLLIYITIDYCIHYNLGLLYQGIQRVQHITHTDALTQRTIANSPTRIPLVLRCHRAIRSISSIFHKQIHIKFSHSSSLVLLRLNIYLSLPSYVLTSGKSAICGLPVRNQSSRLMLWC